MMNRLLNILLCLALVSFIVTCDDDRSGSGDSTPAPTSLGSVRVVPRSIGSGPAEPGAWALFDGDTETAYSFNGTETITLDFCRVLELREMRVFGAPSCSMQMRDAKSGKSLTTLVEGPALDDGRWNTVECESAESSSVTLTFSPMNALPGSASEIEIWAVDAQENRDVLVSKLDRCETPAELLAEFSRSPKNVHVFASDISSLSMADTADSETAALLEFQVTIPPQCVRRAYLAYRASGVYRPVRIERSVNSGPWSGGLAVPVDPEAGATALDLVEEINPEWLGFGTNGVRFRAPFDASLEQIRLYLVTDNGWTFVRDLSEYDAGDGSVSTAAALKSSGSEVVIPFARPVEPKSLMIYLSGGDSARVNLKYLAGGSWKECGDAAGTAVEGGGWKSINAPAGAVADSLMVSLSGAGEDEYIGVGEIMVSASPRGPVNAENRIAISYPRNGEYFGGSAYIQGFVSPEEFCTGVSIEGKQDGRDADDGSFCMALSKKETGKFASQAEDAPWDPVVTAALGTKTINKEIHLYRNLSEGVSGAEVGKSWTGDDEENNDPDHASGDLYSTVVKPEWSKTISYGDLTVTIPAGAVDADTVITIQPLSSSELADLDPGMVNVTSPVAGYRFLPHGRFKKQLEIHFGYSPKLLSSGQKDDDIFMYFHDTKDKRWKRLERVMVAPKMSMVYSVTDHFTDIINATLTVPEHPDALSYNPNTIKDIKAADPSSGVNLIAPPKATNMGDANLSYPIELPKGRQGMQPEVSVRYNSSGGNGWLGVGWDVPVRSITIDTRFGVPRYDDYGDEKYLLDGAQIVPLSEGSTTYVKRVEGDFSRIQRLGSGASTYWVVTDKSGTRHMFGVSRDPLRPSTLQNAGGSKIFQWFLERSVDRNGNCVNYYYDTVTYDPSHRAAGIQTYLSRISYTGTGTTDGPYTVEFIPESTVRPDPIVSCRSGFKVATAHRLSSVTVSYGGSAIRVYRFRYIEDSDLNPFRKSLLSQIDQEDGSGNLFNSHTFEYYDEITNGRGDYIGFDLDENWGGAFLDYLDPGTSDNKEKITKSSGFNIMGNCYIGYSPPLTFGGKFVSAGVKVGGGGGESNQNFAIMDIDGDGRADRVKADSTNNGIDYSPFRDISGGDVLFHDSRSADGFNSSMGHEVNWSIDFGGSGYYYGIGGFGEGNYGETYSETFFADVNGDGRVDRVKDGNTRFSRLEWDEESQQVCVKYSTTSTSAAVVDNSEEESADIENTDLSITENADGTGTSNGETLSADEIEAENEYNLQTEQSSQEEQFRRDDPVRMWRAPYNGYVRISGDVTAYSKDRYLLTDAVYDTYDGVTASIQKGEDVLWSEALLPKGQDVSVAPEGVEHVRVAAGDEIYFRANSGRDGALDVVQWDPEIEYLDTENPDAFDENGREIFRYRASEDFSTAGTELRLTASLEGDILIEGNLFKSGVTSDDIRLQIIKVVTAWSETGGEREIVVDHTEDLIEPMNISSTATGEIPVGELEFGPMGSARTVNYGKSSSLFPSEYAGPEWIDIIEGTETDFPKDYIICRLSSDTPVDWTKVGWRPRLKYTSVKYVETRNTPGEETVIGDDQEPEPPAMQMRLVELADDPDTIETLFDGDAGLGLAPALDFNLPVIMNLFPSQDEYPPEPFVVDADHAGTARAVFDASLYYSGTFPGYPFVPEKLADGYQTRVTFALKRRNAGDPDRNGLVLDGSGVAVKATGTVIFDQQNTEQGFVLLNDSGNNLGGDLVLDSTFEAVEGDELYFVFASEREDFREYVYVGNPSLEISGEAHGAFYKEYTGSPEDEAFGGGHRGWYYGRWNGEEEDLDPDRMKVPTAGGSAGAGYTKDDLKNYAADYQSASQTDSEFDTLSDQIKTFTAMYPDNSYYYLPEEKAGYMKWKRSRDAEIETVYGDTVPDPDRREIWAGMDPDCWISATEMSSTRIGKKYVPESTVGEAPMTTGVEDAADEGEVILVQGIKGKNRGGKRITSNMSHTWGVAVIFYGLSKTVGNSKTEQDFFDFNGDRYPDTVKRGKVKFTRPDGRLGHPEEVSHFRYIRENLSDNYNYNNSISSASASMVTALAAGGKVKGMNESSPNLGLSCTAGWGLTKTMKDFIDMNGDGLPDRVWRDGDNLMVRLNMGYSLGPEENWGRGDVRRNKTANVGAGVSFSMTKGSIGGGLGITSSQSGTEYDYIDMNGDGLADRVSKELAQGPGVGVIARASQPLEVQLNTGDGFGSTIEWKGSDNHLPIGYEATLSYNMSAFFSIDISLLLFGTIVINPGVNAGLNYGRTEVRMQDIDGDGLPDHTYAIGNESQTEVHVAKNRTGKTNLLKKVNRPLGGSFEIVYERAGNTIERDPGGFIREMPQSRWVMSRVTVSDGMESCGDAAVNNHVYRTAYQYGTGHYDRAEREFYGFNRMTESPVDAEDDALTVTTHTYHNMSFYTRGLEIRTVTADGSGDQYVTVVNEYGSRTLVAGSSEFHPLETKRTYYHEGSADAGVVTTEEYAYDNYGNITQYADKGDGEPASDVTAAIEYKYITGNYIMNLPLSITVTDSGGATLRKRTADYDSKGNLRELDRHLADGTLAATNMEYYSNGNIRQVMGPGNENSERYTLTYSYDTATTTYITSITDSFTLTSRAEYDPRFGQPKWTTDTNRNCISYAYDRFGRIAAVTGPYDAINGNTTVDFYYQGTPYRPRPDGTAPTWARTANRCYWESNETIDTVTVVDGLGRVIQTRKSAEALVGAEKRPGMTISGKTIYDAYGRTVAQGQPGFTGDVSSAYIPRSTPLRPTTYEYDAMGRKTRIENPDGTDVTFGYEFGAQDTAARFLTRTIDQMDNEKTALKDARGNIRRIMEDADGTPITTTYAYSPLGEITRVTDDRGNVTTMEYDLLGRRTSITNPDTGYVSYVYDTAGNMIRKTTPEMRAAGRCVMYQYRYNRLERIDYPNMNDVYYTYGDTSATGNRRGRLVSVDNGTVKEEYAYGRLGETIRVDRTVAAMATTPQATYRSEYEYDNLGRMKRLVFPDKETLVYQYDKGGLLKSARGLYAGRAISYVKDIAYDEFGQRKRVIYGNGTTSTYEYDPAMRRLVNLTTSGGGRTLQNISYDYDPSGNITERTNTDFYTTGEESKSSTQTYEYDDLYRLTGSNGEYEKESWLPLFASRQNSYTNSFAYDTIGNITHKGQINEAVYPDTADPVTLPNTTYDYIYEYGSYRPHAVTKAGNKAFTYDLNGNMKSMATTTQTDDGSGGTTTSTVTRNLYWDDENRLLRTNEATALTTYSYDDKGNRVIKSGKYGEVVYVNDNYTVRNGTLISKHVFTGNTRVCSKVSDMEMVDGTSTRVDKGIYYYHGDHLGSSSVITDKTGGFYEHLEYFPYGETWIQEKAETAESLPYKFTGKERDPETGLYYHGARYRDPQIGGWLSADPALLEYLPTGNKNKDSNLPGMGGVFNPINLNLYHYAGNNPVKFVDPDGERIILVSGSNLAFNDPRGKWDTNKVYAFKSTAIDRSFLGWFGFKQKLLGSVEKTHHGGFEGWESNPWYSIYDENGNYVAGFWDTVRKDGEMELYTSGGSFLIDAVSDVFSVLKITKAAKLSNADGLRKLGRELLPGAEDIKELSPEKDVINTILDMTPGIGTYRSGKEFINKGSEDIKNKELLDEVK